MKKTIFLAVFIIFSIKNAHTQSNDIILDYIRVIEKSPLAADAEEAYGEIVRFAEKSGMVYVRISADLCPWFKQRNLSIKWSSFLLGSYVAGSIKPQLLAKTKKEHSYSGILFVLNTYRAIKKMDRKVMIRQLEMMLELQEKKKLKDYIVSLAK